jgi:hypothetical protein
MKYEKGDHVEFTHAISGKRLEGTVIRPSERADGPSSHDITIIEHDGGFASVPNSRIRGIVDDAV